MLEAKLHQEHQGILLVDQGEKVDFAGDDTAPMADPVPAADLVGPDLLRRPLHLVPGQAVLEHGCVQDMCPEGKLPCPLAISSETHQLTKEIVVACADRDLAPTLRLQKWSQ